MSRYVFRDGLTGSVRGSPSPKIGTLSRETVLLLNSVQASLDDNWPSGISEVGKSATEYYQLPFNFSHAFVTWSWAGS